MTLNNTTRTSNRKKNKKKISQAALNRVLRKKEDYVNYINKYRQS